MLSKYSKAYYTPSPLFESFTPAELRLRESINNPRFRTALVRFADHYKLPHLGEDDLTDAFRAYSHARFPLDTPDLEPFLTFLIQQWPTTDKHTPQYTRDPHRKQALPHPEVFRSSGRSI